MPIRSVEIPAVALTTSFLCRFNFTDGPLFQLEQPHVNALDSACGVAMEMS